MTKTEVLSTPGSQMSKLPIAVMSDTSALSPQAKRDIQALSGARPVRFTLELVFAWLTIAALIAWGVYAESIAVTVLCIVLISTRQMVLALLLHEQVHRLGWRSKYGDWLVNLFAAYPLFVTTVEDYAKVHLSHHKYFFTKKDPDFIRKAGEEWTFPKSFRKFMVIVLKDLTALNVIRLIRGKSGAAIAEFDRRNPSPKWLRIGFFVTAAAVLTAIGGWKIFLCYWVLPLMTCTQLMVRWIAICEHQYNVENGTIHETTPMIKLTWWQRLLTPDLNFGLHVYHHMHSGVSFSNLPKVHRIYVQEGLVNDSAIFNGQGAYLKYLLSTKN